MRDLWRLVLWGLAAAAALSVVVYVGTTQHGRERVKLALATIYGASPAVRPFTAQEGRQLSDTVRTLAEDHERLISRVAAIERGVDGVAGSIAKMQKEADAARQKEPPEVAATPSVAPDGGPADDITSSVTPRAGSAQTTVVGKAQFALDLGTASTVDAVRLAWSVALRRYGSQLQGLIPMIHLRQRPGRPELHLLAGPLPTATAAAKLCTSLTGAGAICAPALFEGERLALH